MVAVAMICQGPNCGKVFEAKRKTAMYCCNKCSVRASRAGQLGKATVAPASAQPRRARGSSALEQATRRELGAAGRLSSSAGQRALLLARRLDRSDQETGAAIASMSTAHAAAMERALAAGPAADPVSQLQDEVGNRRQQRERKAAGKAGVQPPARI
jgi:hypothetical protein